jgi:hypothetical protein
MVLLAGLGASAALAVGQTGRASHVVVRHDTLVQQLPGETGAAVAMRGVVEFPSLDTYAVRMQPADAFIEPAARAAQRRHTFDESGEPVLEGTFALGTRQAFSLQGFVQTGPVVLVTDGSLTRVANRSQVELAACRFADGFSVRDVGVLRPGQTAEATQLAASAGPAFTCALTSLPFGLSEASHTIREEGTIRLAVYRAPSVGQ